MQKKNGLDDRTCQELNTRVLQLSASQKKPIATSDAKLETAIQRVTQLYNKGERNQSLKEAQRLLAEHRDSFELFNIIGVIKGHLKMYEEAAESFQKAISLKPNFASGYNNLGNIYK